MTQKEKARAYDELLVKAKKIYNEENDVLIMHTIEDLFSAFKEPDDEKIRKGLIKGLSAMRDIHHRQTFSDDAININEALAWLEKQGSEPNWCHHKVDLSNCSEEYQKAYYDGWNNCNMQHSQCKSDGNDVVKCLINGMKFYYEDDEEATWGTDKFSMKVKDILSWLEKQRTSEEALQYVKDNHSSSEASDFQAAMNIAVAKAYDKGYNDGFKKQGEQKVSEYDIVKTIKERIIEHFDNHLIIDKCFSIGGLKYDILKIINEVKFSKQGEQKLVDKVEPTKFKVGDWIVNNRSKDTFFLKSVNSGYCSLEDGKSNIYSPCLPFESDFHLWTIADAKDGDVLCYETKDELRIFIYIGYGHTHYHCCYCNEHLTTVDSFFVIQKHLESYLHPATKEQRETLFKAMANAGYIWDADKKKLEKIEQNPINKIKPKFKVGDFIVNDYCMGRVIEITNDAYLLDSGQGIPFSCHTTRLWDITKDAKQGNVLANDHNILILKELNYDWSSNGFPYSVHAYCGIKPNGNFELGKENWCFCGTLHMRPATSEERDLLFAKMREAGYGWNPDKKELKKIEQKPVVIVPKFKVGDKVYAIKDRFECTIESIDEATYYGDTTNFDIKDQDNWKLVEQNQSWGEEDEDAIGMAIIALEDMYDEDAPNTTYGGYNLPFNKAAKRLKSLKDRVQPKQEWSEEDEANLNNIVWLCNDCINGSETTWIPSQATRIKSLIERIKDTVFLQPKQEWSEEDEQYLLVCKNALHKYESTDKWDADIIFNWLKSLKDRVV